MLGICVEASHQRGMGHLFRVLNLCETLVERRIPFRIFSNPDEASQALLAGRKLAFDLVPFEDGRNDWQAQLISRYGISLWLDDRLNTDSSHAIQVKNCGIPLVTFDDRGSGAALSDLNVMALAFEEAELLQGKKVLQGPRYLVLNREIEKYRRLRKQAGSIVVTLGGSDTYGVTVKVVRMLKAKGLGATVIVGPAFRHETELNDVLDEGFTLKRSVPSLMEEFSHHDLAITGGGITPFEANASGLPCIVIANEDFEVAVGRGIAALGGAVFAGHFSAVDDSVFAGDLPIGKMSEAAMAHVDLLGASRVVDELEALL